MKVWYYTPCRVILWPWLQLPIMCTVLVHYGLPSIPALNKTRPFLYMGYYNRLYSEYTQRCDGMSGLFWNIGASSKFWFLTTLTCSAWKLLNRYSVKYLGWVGGVRGEGVLWIVTNKPTNQRAEGADLSEGATRRPSVCLVFSACTASLDSVTGTWNCNWDCAYANEFTSRLKTPTWANWGPLLRRQ
jgi:hypothetical protein